MSEPPSTRTNAITKSHETILYSSTPYLNKQACPLSATKQHEYGVVSYRSRVRGN